MQSKRPTSKFEIKKSGDTEKIHAQALLVNWIGLLELYSEPRKLGKWPIILERSSGSREHFNLTVTGTVAQKRAQTVSRQFTVEYAIELTDDIFGSTVSSPLLGSRIPRPRLVTFVHLSSVLGLVILPPKIYAVALYCYSKVSMTLISGSGLDSELRDLRTSQPNGTVTGLWPGDGIIYESQILHVTFSYFHWLTGNKTSAATKRQTIPLSRLFTIPQILLPQRGLSTLLFLGLS